MQLWQLSESPPGETGTWPALAEPPHPSQCPVLLLLLEQRAALKMHCQVLLLLHTKQKSDYTVHEGYAI